MACMLFGHETGGRHACFAAIDDRDVLLKHRDLTWHALQAHEFFRAWTARAHTAIPAWPMRVDWAWLGGRMACSLRKYIYIYIYIYRIS